MNTVATRYIEMATNLRRDSSKFNYCMVINFHSTLKLKVSRFKGEKTIGKNKEDILLADKVEK